MKAKRLIEILQSIVQEQGDVNVFVPQGRGPYGNLKDARQQNSGGVVYLHNSDTDWDKTLCGRHRVYRQEPVVIRREYEQL